MLFYLSYFVYIVVCLEENILYSMLVYYFYCLYGL